MTLADIAKTFATVEACLQHLETVRWRNGPFCPNCGSTRKIHHFKDGRRHKCADCRRIFRITTGTVFTGSPLRLLPQWFMAIYLVTSRGEGISSAQLARDIGVTQKTAWHMIQRIHTATALATREAAATPGAGGGGGLHARSPHGLM